MEPADYETNSLEDTSKIMKVEIKEVDASYSETNEKKASQKTIESAVVSMHVEAEIPGKKSINFATDQSSHDGKPNLVMIDS